MAVTLAAMAGAVALLSVETSLHTVDDAVQQTIARGLAEQLADEILGARYMSPGGNPQQYPMSANAWELQGEGRERFDDTDDFHGFTARPPEDRYGVEIGLGDGAGGYRHPAFQVRSDYFDRWQQRIEMYYVNPANLAQRLSGSQASDYRCLEVTIFRREPGGAERPLAKLRQVFAYAPHPQ